MSEKCCTVCKQVKPLDAFSQCRNGHQPSCKACRNQKSKAKNIPVCVQEKKCRTCGDTKPASEFCRAKHRSDGLQSECKQCYRHRRSAVSHEVTLAEKTCVDCGLTKPAAEFPKDSKRIGGLRKECRSCASIRCRATIYKLSYDECAEMCSRSACEICKKGFSDPSEKNIDHCHRTGVVRGTLCNACNRMLGSARDNPWILDQGAKYLRDKRVEVMLG